MTEFKLVISTKDGKSVQKEVKSPEADAFLGKKIRDKIRGNDIGFKGYEFEIRGGADSSGFPMRLDAEGSARRRILTIKSLGVKKTNRKGLRLRKTVAGNTIHEKINQINLVVVKAGKEPLATPPVEEKAKEKTLEKGTKEDAKPEEKKK